MLVAKTKENLSLREEAQIHDMYLAKYFTLTYDKGIALTAVRENKLSNYNLEKNNLLELKEIVAGFNRSLRVARMAQMLAEIIADRNYFLSNVQYEPVSTDTLAFKEYKKLEKEVYESKLM